jgi:zinc protease
MIERKTIPTVEVQVYYRVGSKNEPKNQTGSSHFLEHMISTGSPMFENKKSIAEFSKKYMLNSRNAVTSSVSLSYVFKTLPEKYVEAMKGVKDILFNPYLRKEDIENERKIITQEAWNRFQNEKFLNYIKELNNNCYFGTQKERFYSALGWPKSIEKINQDDLKKYHKKYFGVGNMFIVLTGNVSEANIKELKKWTKDLPKVNSMMAKKNLRLN